MNNLFLSLDLEMNQPSGRIIQIGACILDRRTGAIVDQFSQVVNPNETLSPFIIQLTGITQAQVNAGVPLIEAYEKLNQFWRPNVIPIGTPSEKFYNAVCWGGDDMRCLADQLFKPHWFISLLRTLRIVRSPSRWHYGHRIIDVKTLFQSWCIKRDVKPASGLAKSLRKVGLNFEGRKHDALSDSINTARLLHWLWVNG